MTGVGPGGTLGILGGGQLARMIAEEARRMGYRVAVLDPDPECPASLVADETLAGNLDDFTAALSLAHRADVVTIDTEHVPFRVIEAVERVRRTFPSSRTLAITQDRLEQKRFLSRWGAPLPRFAPVSSEAELHEASSTLGFPAVLKTRHLGYDGRGQVVLRTPADVSVAWSRVGGVPAVLEEFVHFTKELSVVAVRDAFGHVRAYPVVENVHRRHVLHTTRAPAVIPRNIAREATALTERLMEAFGIVGVMAVELLLKADGRLLVNEVAARVHNSGHFTWGACVTSQFEQHVRAICGLPLGDTSLMSPAVMVNLLGELFADHEPTDTARMLEHPGARLFLYGKARPRPGRKMGHLLIVDDDAERALQAAERVVSELSKPPTSNHPPGNEP